MARDAQQNAQNTYNTASNLTGSSQTKADALYGQLAPAYQQEATNPTGFNPTEMSDMTTSAEQSAGGAAGTAKGELGTLTAANRNIGGVAPAIDQSARDAGKTLSADSLGIQGDNARLKLQQQQEGLAGLSGLEGQQNNDVLSSLGLQTSANNSLVNAGNSGWFQNMTGMIGALRGAGATNSSGGGFTV